MNYRLMFILNTIVAAVVGVLLVAAPKASLLMFGVNDAYVSAQMMTRFFGGALVVTAALLWLLSELSSSAQKNAAIALMVGSVGGFILTIVGMVSDKVIRSNGWILLVVYLLFAVGYAYLVFRVSVKVKGVKK